MSNAESFVDLVNKNGSLRVTIHELPVKEVRAWTVEIEAGRAVDPLRAFVFDDCSLDDLALMSDVSAEQLEAYGPSELERVRAKAKALNPLFFKVREALHGVSRILLAEIEPPVSTP